MEQNGRGDRVERSILGPAPLPVDPNRFLERLLAGSSNLVYIYDLFAQSNVYANQNLLEFLGYPAEQVRDFGAELMASILHPEDVAAVVRHHSSFASATDKDTHVLDYRVRNANGHWRWLQSRDVVYARREDGTPSQILGTAADITEERRSLEALQESEEKFRSIVQASPVAKHFYRLEDDGRLVLTGANPSADRITGVDHTSLVGKTIEEAFPGLMATSIPELYWKVASGELGQQTFEIAYTEGGIRGYYDVLVFRTGQNTIAVDFLDITERKESEAALRESEFFFTESQRAGSVGSYKCDFVAGTWKSSEVLDGIFGIDVHYRRTIAGWLDLIHPEDAGMMSRYLVEDVIGHREAFTKEYRIIRKSDGVVRWVHGLGNVGCDSQGTVITLTGTIQDITERKQAEIELRESNQFIRAIIESVHEGVIVYGTDYRYKVWNPFMARLSGLQPEEVLGKQPSEVFPFLQGAGVLERIGRTLTGESPDPIEFPFTSRGNSGWARDTCSPLRNVEGEIIGVIGTVVDITDRKRDEDAKAKLQAQFQQSQKMESLGTLAGGVAHDMNNVLGAILALASAHVGTQPYGSPLHRALDTICKATERGGKMVKSLLSFARQSPAERNLLDMNAILKEQVGLLERTTLAKVRLELDLEAKLSPIQGDCSALSHAVMNLCVNAVDAMPDNGILTLRTRNLENGWIEVQVEDTGAGMSKAVLEKAMDPFFTTKEVGKGTGLGLSMVFSTVKAHRGHMTIQSEPRQGTRVVIGFPACESDDHFVTADFFEAMPPTNGVLKVLLVDDDELIQSSVQEILTVLGHTEVSMAPCGEEALAMLEKGMVPDIVILDMNMPGLGGARTLPRLRQFCPAVPVILCTGRTDQTALNLAQAYPNVTLLSKPFGLRELQKQLQSIGLG